MIPSTAINLLSDDNIYSKFKNNIIKENITNGLKDFTEFILS